MEKTAIQQAIESVSALGEFKEGASPVTPENKILGKVCALLTGLLPVEKEQMQSAWFASESSEWCDDGFDGYFEQTYSAQ